MEGLEKIGRLIAIAQDLAQQDLVEKLTELQTRMNRTDTELILPLVGEFSSGKTTLINALTDSKQLETATKPTTATIYQIFFGYDSCRALVMYENGSCEEVADISQLKNENLHDVVGVNIFDTSTKVPSATVLVDTPGLSSSDPKHRQALMDFLPNADAVILVVDINQQITRSLTDFIKDMALVHRPVYLVVTKSDTKAPRERLEVKKYIASNCQIDISNVACVSAKGGDLTELSVVFDTIRNDKAQILDRVNGERLKVLAQELAVRVTDLLAETASYDKLEESIKGSKAELDKLKRNIDNLINDTEAEVRNVEKTICRSFNNTVFERLDSLVVSKCDNFDVAAQSIISSAQSLHLGDYKNKVQEILYEKARNRRLGDNGINLQSLNEIDCYGQTAFSEIPYNLNLNVLGHEYDGFVAGGVKVLATVGLAAATVATAGAALAGAGAVAGAGAIASGAGTVGIGKTLITANVIDSVTDVASMVSNRKLRLDMEKARHVAREYSSASSKVEGVNQNIGQQLGQKKGIIEGLVSKFTAGMGKPQRQRAIHEYINSILVPHFEEQMKSVSSGVLSVIKETLNNEASEIMSQKQQNLEQLEQQYKTSKEEFDARRETLLRYTKELEVV